VLRLSCRRFLSDNRQVLARSAWIPAGERSARRLPSRRRPIVNGQLVPFHVQDLPHGAATTTVSRQNHVKVHHRPSRSYSSDLIVVLDLDECLVHAKFFDERAHAALYAHQVQNNTNGTADTAATATEPVESFRINVDRNVLAHVNMRPGVLRFLQHITSTYETHIYTAATSIYADAVLDHLCACLGATPEDADLFAGRWYREHCAHDPVRGAYVKDLSRLPVALHRTVLVDNNPLSFLAQPENGILVNSFFADGTDRTLESVSRFIADELAPVTGDVRSVLTERFQLPELIKRIETESPTTKPSSLSQLQPPPQSRPHVRPHLAML
jgi:Dullard-like phosphatase family protein